MSPFRALALAAVACAALPAFGEGVTVVFKVEDPRGSHTATTYLSDDRVRTSEGDYDVVVDFASRKLYSLNTAKREYSESTFDDIRSAMERVDARTRRMQEQLKDNPKATEMLEKIMGAGGPLDVKVTKGAGSRTIAGFVCEPHTLTMGKAISVEIWTSSALRPPPQLFEARKLLAPPGNPMGDRFARLYEEMKKIDGYPLAENTTVDTMGSSVKSSREATEVTRGPIPAATFAVPADYKKVESPYAKMLQK